MSWKTDDPRLTDYALNELDQSERAEVEAAMKAQPELAAAVEEIRQSSKLFSEAFKAENKFLLALDQRQKVLGIDKIKKRSSRTFWLALSSIAAGLASLVIFTGQQKHLLPGVVSHKETSTEEVMQEFIAAQQAAREEESSAKVAETKGKVAGLGALAKREAAPAPPADPAAPAAPSADIAMNDSVDAEAVEESVQESEAEMDSAEKSNVRMGGATLKKESLNQFSGSGSLEGMAKLKDKKGVTGAGSQSRFEIAVKVIEGDAGAKPLLESLKSELRRCDGADQSPTGDVKFTVDPETKEVTVGSDGLGRPAVIKCWLEVLNKRNWPGTKPYRISVGIH